MDKELKRLNRLIESNGRKLAVFQTRQNEYLKQRTEIHNTMMLQLLNENEFTPQLLKELLDRAENHTIVPKAQASQEGSNHA